MIFLLPPGIKGLSQCSISIQSEFLIFSGGIEIEHWLKMGYFDCELSGKFILVTKLDSLLKKTCWKEKFVLCLLHRNNI